MPKNNGVKPFVLPIAIYIFLSLFLFSSRFNLVLILICFPFWIWRRWKWYFLVTSVEFQISSILVISNVVHNSQRFTRSTCTIKRVQTILNPNFHYYPQTTHTSFIHFLIHVVLNALFPHKNKTKQRKKIIFFPPSFVLFVLFRLTSQYRAYEI
jgi:hypothetical protein